MAKSRKKTYSQQVVGLAAMAMPAPVRDVLVTRWGARLAVLASAALMTTGIVSLQWDENGPHVKLNRERAMEVKEKVNERIEAAEKKPANEKSLTERWGFGDTLR